MILVDTNIWCDFFRKGDALLDLLLSENRVIMHSIVIGELAMGNLPSRKQTLRDLHYLARISEVSVQDCFIVLESQSLFGRGIQWNDLQILTSVKFELGTQLWTRDLRLSKIAHELGVCFQG